MGKNFGRKAVMAGCIGMAAVALLVTVLTLQGILALGSGQERTQDDAVVEEEKAIRTAADGNWGLSFQNKGSAPTANATSEYLKKYNAYYIGNEKSKEKTIYLTFDAGYENGYTAVLLDVLKEEKVPAAFFVVGNFIEENPELVKRMTAEGHIVGNHTMHHPDMSAIADEAGFRKEMSELEDAYRAATGEKMLKFLFFLYKDQETSYRFFAIIHRLFSKEKAALFFFFCFLQLNLRSGLISTMAPARPFLYFFKLHIFQ